MANPWAYPQSRWILMQVAMGLLLCAAVGVAAGVSAHRRAALQVPLGPPVQVAGGSIQLPRSWAVRQGASRDFLLQAVEPAGAKRTLTLLRQPLRRMISPQEYLARSRDGLVLDPQRMPIGQQPGILVARPYVLHPPNGEPAARKQVIACAVLPTRQAVVLELEGPGSVEPADVELIRQVSQTLRLDLPPMLEPDSVELPGGIAMDLPAGFELVAETDPLCLSRTLVRQQSPTEWMSIVLVPCVFGPEDKEPAVQTLLSLHGREWRFGSAKKVDERTWRVDPPAPGDQREALFPRRAYLLRHEDGQALLAIFRGGGPAADERFEGIWRRIAHSVGFRRRIDLPALQLAGAREASRLREFGLTNLLANLGGEDEWWMWYAEPYAGWTHLTHLHGDEWEARRETRWRFGGGDVRRILQWCASDDDMNRYQARTEIAAAEGPASAFEEAWVLRTLLADGQVVMDLSAEQATRPVPAVPAPEGFVPGGWLRLVMDNLSPRPMLLQTDLFFIGHDVPCPSEPLTLLIEPGEPPGGTKPAAEHPPRSLRVQLNGSGQSSVWMFGDEGDLVRIDLPGGAHIDKVQRDTIRYTFADDERMVP